MKEAKVGFIEIGIPFFSAIIDLVQTSMTSKHAKNYIVAFKAFARVVLVKLDMFEVTNN